VPKRKRRKGRRKGPPPSFSQKARKQRRGPQPKEVVPKPGLRALRPPPPAHQAPLVFCRKGANIFKWESPMKSFFGPISGEIAFKKNSFFPGSQKNPNRLRATNNKVSSCCCQWGKFLLPKSGRGWGPSGPLSKSSAFFCWIRADGSWFPFYRIPLECPQRNSGKKIFGPRTFLIP